MDFNKETVRYNLLYVDDEAINLLAFSKDFGQNYNVFTAVSPKKGFKILKENEIHLIISDYLMPGMNGTEFLGEVKKKYPDSKLILISAYDDFSILVKAVNDIGIFRFIGKPYEPKKFGQIITNALNNYQLEQDKSYSERILIESLGSLSEAQRIAHLGNWNWDIPGNTIKWSDEIYRIFGLRPKEFKPTYEDFINYVHPDDREYLQQVVTEAINNGTYYNITHRIIRPDKTERIVREQASVTLDNHGKAVQMVGTVQDISEQKIAEEKLKENQKKLLTAQYIARMGFLDWDLKTNHLELSSELVRLFGIDLDEKWSSPEIFRNIVHPDDYDFVQKSLDMTMESGESQLFDHRIVRPDGKILWMHSTTELITDTERNPVSLVLTAIDITQSKKTEAELEQHREHLEDLVRERTQELKLSETRNRSILDAVPDKIFRVRRDGTYLEFIPGKEMNTIVPVQDFIGKTISDIIQTEVAQLIMETIELAFTTGKVQTTEYQLRILEEIHYIDARFISMGKDEVMIIERDVSERKKAEESLKRHSEELEGMNKALIKSRKAAMSLMQDARIQKEKADGALTELQKSTAEFNKLSRAIERSPVAVVITDEKGSIEYVNPHFSKTTGYRPDEVLGKNPRLWKSEKMPEVFYRNLWSTIKSGSIWKGDFRNRKKNGDIYWVRASISPVTNQDGRIINFVDVMEDITLQKQINDELKIAKETAEAATKIKSNFLANMSHEIRTPMNAIIGMSYLLEQTDLSVKQEDYLGKIRKSSENLLGLINDILDISKIEAGKLKIETIDFDLNYVFEKLFTILHLKAQEKGLELIYESAGDVPVYLRGDPLRLGQILLNLAGNAVKFTESGKVVISTKLISNDSDSVVIQFSVKDKGHGMTEKHMSKLFKPFSQADSSTTRLFGGTGLGLAISKGLIDNMHGKIWVESKFGKGSTFYFTVKLGIQKNRLHSVIKGICNYVLVISSDEVSENILHSYLEDFSCKSVLFDPLKVLEKGFSDSDIFKNENPDLVILENSVSSLICIDVVKRIRSVHILDSVPVIIISDERRIKKIQMSMAEGEIDLFLTRPISQSTLHDSILRLLEGKERLVSIKEAKFPEIEKDLDTIRGARILLVEDNELNTQIAKEFLEQEGFKITTAVNGEDALNKFIYPEDFDLILMDLQMPVMDGYKAAKLIRHKKGFEDLPILAMTADAVSGAREKVIDAGMNDYITKPFDPEDVLKALIKWIKPDSIRKTEKEQVDKYVDDNADFRTLSLEGIDTESGIKRIGGNLNSYIRLLTKFTENYKDFGYQFNNSKNEEEKLRLVHSLKGISGNIGANQLYEAIVDLEKALKEKQIKKTPALINKVIALLEIIINSIKQLDKSISSERPSREVELIRDTEELKREIKKLKEYLSSYDSSGIDFFDEIKTSLENIGFEANTELINNYLEKYDFDNALSVLTGIEGELNDNK